MTQSEALAKARELWGENAWADTIRNEVGCRASVECAIGVMAGEYRHVYGAGPTWDAAVRDAIKGEPIQ